MSRRIAVLATALMLMGLMLTGTLGVARARDATPTPSPGAPDAAAIDAAALRALCESRPADAEARRTCLELVNGTLLPLLDLARERPLIEREVFGFLPYWELDDAEGIDLTTLTTLAWFGLEAGGDGRLVRATEAGGATPGWAGWTGEAFGDLMARAQAADVSVVLTVQRFAWDAAGEAATVALLDDPSVRAALVEDVVATITERGADGVNLDFEPLPSAVRGAFTDLVRELRAGLDAVDPTLQLTFDLLPSVKGYQLGRLVGAEAADAVVLMGYEYRTAGSRVAGAVAPLRDPDGLDLRGSVRRVLRRVPADRVILALPWYGRAWSTRDRERGSRTRRDRRRFIAPTTAQYEDAVRRAASAGRRYDRRQASAWSVYPASACETCPVGPRQLWFDDADAFGAKVRLAVRRGLRGVGIWALGYQGEREELWSALRLALEGGTDAEPPSGSVELAAGSVLGEREGLPLVGETVTLELTAEDGADGSGVAYVRVATRSRLTDSGRLRRGTTFPAVASVSVSLPRAEPVAEVFVPPGVEPPSSPVTPASEPGPRTLHVQWRDVAGNWSDPVRVRVYHEPGTRPSPAASPPPSPGAD